jgi:hypothetical protein
MKNEQIRDADVRLVAGHSENLEQGMLSIIDESLVVDLQDFMNEEEDYCDELGAL